MRPVKSIRVTGLWNRCAVEVSISALLVPMSETTASAASFGALGAVHLRNPRPSPWVPVMRVSPASCVALQGAHVVVGGGSFGSVVVVGVYVACVEIKNDRGHLDARGLNGVSGFSGVRWQRSCPGFPFGQIGFQVFSGGLVLCVWLSSAVVFPCTLGSGLCRVWRRFGS